ncbi:hypothetical protein H0H93_003056 [Arthromyces matolae]|nr:hypothetical protein H0H93_003056 [Arthromyces matolae]
MVSKRVIDVSSGSDSDNDSDSSFPSTYPASPQCMPVSDTDAPTVLNLGPVSPATPVETVDTATTSTLTADPPPPTYLQAVQPERGRLVRSKKGVLYRIGVSPHPSELVDFTADPDVVVQGYHVVWVGQRTGIFPNWPDTAALVMGVPGSLYKSFCDWESALGEYSRLYHGGRVETRILVNHGGASAYIDPVDLATAHISALHLA